MSDRQWLREGHDHGAALARDLGYRAIYVHYNSGKHVAASGAELASALDELVSSQATDVDEIAIVSHSMGGLVARAACHAAETRALAWRQKLRAIVFLGTPHHGSPLERGGNWLEVLLGVSRYSAPLARLGRIRSAGVTDLRFGNVLDEHARGGDRFEMATDSRRPLPLPEGVACYAIAASTSPEASGGRRGDGLVPVDSALGIHASPEMTLAFAPANTSIAPGIGHRELLSNLDVYERIRSWLAAGRTSAGSG